MLRHCAKCIFSWAAHSLCMALAPSQRPMRWGVRLGTYQKSCLLLLYVILSEHNRCDCGRWGQGSAHRGADQRRVRTAVENCAPWRRVSLRKQHNKLKHNGRFYHDCAVISGCGGIGCEGDEIPRSWQIVVDAILTSWSWMRCTQCVDKTLVFLACLPYTLLCVDHPVRFMTTKERPYWNTPHLVVIIPGTTKVVPWSARKL